MNPIWVTLEGVEGVGKTYLADRLAKRLGNRCLLLNEITDLTQQGLPGQVVAALSSAGDVFLRTGHPLTETFALLALKVWEYEHLQATGAGDIGIVVEDRGVDSVAVYQAAILADQAPIEQLHTLAQRVYATANRWRPPPDLTLLLVDDLAVCAARFAGRLGRPLHDHELVLMRLADQLYARQAAAEPERFVIVDRTQHAEQETLDLLHAACSSRVGAAEE